VNEIPDTEVTDVNEDEIQVDASDLLEQEQEMNLGAKAEVFEEINE